MAHDGNLERIICPRSWREGSRAGGVLGMLGGPAPVFIDITGGDGDVKGKGKAEDV